MYNIIFIFIIIIVFVLFGCNKNNQQIESNNKSVSDNHDSTQQNKQEVKSENLVLNLSQNDKVTEIQCLGMTCRSCEKTIIKKIKKIDGVSDVIADYKSNTVKASYDPSKTNPQVISEAISSSGYKVLNVK